MFRWLLFFCSVSILNSAKIVKQISVYYKEELVNNCHFAYRLDTIDGDLKEAWYVNEQEADQERFEQMIEHAKCQEYAQKRAKKREQQMRASRIQERALRKKAQMKLAKIIKKSEKALSNLTHYDVEHYYAFSSATIASKSMLAAMRYEQIPAAQAAINSQDSTLKALQEFIDEMHELPVKLNDFFYATIDNALATCSDSKLLKKLLTLVPEVDVLG